jgi:hypothetical protein
MWRETRLQGLYRGVGTCPELLPPLQSDIRHLVDTHPPGRPGPNPATRRQPPHDTHCQQRPYVPGNTTQGLRLRPPTDVLCYYLQQIPTLRNEENKWGEPTADSAGHPTLTKLRKLPLAERASSCPPCQTISLQPRVPPTRRGSCPGYTNVEVVWLGTPT